MKNVVFLCLAIVLFVLAYYLFWIFPQENSLAGEAATRSAAPRSMVRPATGLMAFVQQYQPYLTLASSLGGIASFLFQLRIWMRSRS